jgi:hypothetical protein
MFKSAHLRITVAHAQGQFALGEFGTLAQILEQGAKGGEFLW